MNIYHTPDKVSENDLCLDKAENNFCEISQEDRFSSGKVGEFLRNLKSTPHIVIDYDYLRYTFLKIKECFHKTQIFYAVKANPDPAIVRLFHSLGSNFDVASPGEIKLCIELGIHPERMSYGNTIKKAEDILFAWNLGVRLFSFDCIEELHKISRNAPCSKVICRIQADHGNAKWPLNRKFGCTPERALDLLSMCSSLGLIPEGISFHVGSQMEDISAWDKMIEKSSLIWKKLAALGIEIKTLNIGGGLPANYSEKVEDCSVYASRIKDIINSNFPSTEEINVMLEPGRALVADAGIIESEVILVTKDNNNPELRWVYLDTGIFNGLFEALEEAIMFKMKAVNKQGEEGPCVIAGPTCDSLDLMYQKSSYLLPLDLEAGDRIRIFSCGAYSSTYASVNFNGFPSINTTIV